MLKSFQTKIGLFYSMLLAVVQLTTFGLVYYMIETNVFEKSKDQLIYSSQIFNHQISDISTNFKEHGYQVANDVEFRKAVGIQSTKILLERLRALSHEVGADQALLISNNNSILINTAENSSLHENFPFSDIMETARTQGYAESILVIENKVYQFVVIPVFNPNGNAWIGMGVEIDDLLIEQFSKLTSLDVKLSFAHSSLNGHWSYPDTVLQGVSNQLKTILHSELKSVNDFHHAKHFKSNDIITLLMPIHTPASSPSVVAILQYSLKASLVPYQSLLMALILISVAGLLIALVSAVLIARKIAKPISRLTQAIQRIEQGNLHELVPIENQDEIGQLTETFNTMMQGIARREERIQFQMNHDTVTKLPNRHHFEQHLQAYLSKSDPERDSGLLLLISIERFYEINHCLGHCVGDQLIHAIGLRLSNRLRADMVARFTSSSFIIHFHQNTLDDSKHLIEQVLNLFHEPFSIFGSSIDIHVRIGISSYPNHGHTPAQLMQHADVALFRAKKVTHQHAIYTSSFDPTAVNQLSLMSELRKGLETGEFELFYQPIINLNTSVIDQVEALVRWHHPRNGLMNPSQFIPLAEETGHIKHLSLWVIKTAISQLENWQQKNIQIKIAINLSMQDFLHRPLLELMVGLLTEKHVPGDQLIIEMTEGTMMRDPDYMLEKIKWLNTYDIKLAIDDFGTGYSSLNYLKQLPVSELKIDRTFIRELATSPSDEKIVRSIIELGHNLNLKVVAEGIESIAVIKSLKALKCDLAQGFQIAKPMKRSDFESWLLQHTSKNDSEHQNHLASLDTTDTTC
ncbi:MAG: EAL domain-containing protein [Gammaproteobacteria bacterium]